MNTFSGAHWSFTCLLCRGLFLEKMNNPSWAHPGPTPGPPAAQPLPISGRAPQAHLPAPGSSLSRLCQLPHVTLQTPPPLPSRPASLPVQSSSPFSIPLTAKPARPPCPSSITALITGTHGLTAGKNRQTVKQGGGEERGTGGRLSSVTGFPPPPPSTGSPPTLQT